MCLYNLRRYGCGHDEWSEWRKKCQWALDNNEYCSRKQVLRGSYASACFNCSHVRLSRDYYRYVPTSEAEAPQRFCREPRCQLDAAHVSDHQLSPQCTVENCVRYTGHAGHHYRTLVDGRQHVQQREQAEQAAIQEATARLMLLVLSNMAGTNSTVLHQTVSELFDNRNLRGPTTGDLHGLVLGSWELFIGKDNPGGIPKTWPSYKTRELRGNFWDMDRTWFDPDRLRSMLAGRLFLPRYENVEDIGSEVIIPVNKPGVQPSSPTSAGTACRSIQTRKIRNSTQKTTAIAANRQIPELRKSVGLPDWKPQLSACEIRLFELFPAEGDLNVRGSYHSMHLNQPHLSYTALSYTWGDQTKRMPISFSDGSIIAIGLNLWNFLRLQASIIKIPQLFWIDALCIDQANIHERNHQVGMMGEIYASAAEVYLWLGVEADDSDLAMKFLNQQSSQGLRPRGPGYHPIWSRRQGKALQALCDRLYWRRSWIIQEIFFAQHLTLWCGTKQCDWSHLEALYVQLKVFEEKSWITHHYLHTAVLQSSAASMVWQRAHYRHPETPTPSLQTLIEIFRDWQCTDVRDKVYALVGMAAGAENVVPDYSLPPRNVYYQTLDVIGNNDIQFSSLLSQLLGLDKNEIELRDRSLIEYKTLPAERLVLKARLEGWWSDSPEVF